MRLSELLEEQGMDQRALKDLDITGLTAQTTPAAFNGRLPDWVAGAAATTIAQARQNCAGGGFTGVAPTLAQYASGSFDADLRCGS